MASVRGGGSFDVQGLAWNYAQGSGGKDILKDFTLTYFPGQTSESYTVTCEDNPPYTAPPGPYWSGIYWVLHYPTEFAPNGPGSDPGDAPSVPPMPDIGALLEEMGGDSGGAVVPVMPLAMPGGAGAAGGYLARNWEIEGGDILATKEWEMEDPSVGISEEGQFTLYHRPGQ